MIDEQPQDNEGYWIDDEATEIDEADWTNDEPQNDEEKIDTTDNNTEPPYPVKGVARELAEKIPFIEGKDRADTIKKILNDVLLCRKNSEDEDDRKVYWELMQGKEKWNDKFREYLKTEWKNVNAMAECLKDAGIIKDSAITSTNEAGNSNKQKDAIAYNAVLAKLQQAKTINDLPSILNEAKKQNIDDFAKRIRYDCIEGKEKKEGLLAGKDKQFYTTLATLANEDAIDADFYDKQIIEETNAGNFTPTIWANIHFQPSTINTIVARPGQGKTTTLISLAMDALRQKDKDGNSKYTVAFIGTEEPSHTTYKKMILNEAYELACNGKITNEHILKLMTIDDGGFTKNEFKPANALGYYIRYKNDKNTPSSIKKGLENCNAKEMFSTAMENVKHYFLSEGTKKRLYLHDTDADTFEEVIDYLTLLPEYSIVLLDYLQKLPIIGDNNKGTRQTELQTAIAELEKVVKSQHLTLIAGAQLNREVKITDTASGNINLENIREADDIAHVSTLVLATAVIREENEIKTAYYKVLKNRSYELDETPYMLGRGLTADVLDIPANLAFSHLCFVKDTDSYEDGESFKNKDPFTGEEIIQAKKAELDNNEENEENNRGTRGRSKKQKILSNVNHRGIQ